MLAAAENVIRVDFKKLQKQAAKKRLSSRKIADATGGVVTFNAVHSILTGRVKNPGIVTVKAICDVIGFPIEDTLITRRRRAA